MGRLRDYAAKLARIKTGDLDKGLLKIVDDHKSQALDMNDAQMLSGLDSQGRSIGEYKSKSYEEFKRQLNPEANGRVDLHLTGDFARGLKLDDSKFPVTFYANDSKSEVLSEKYGERIYGLDQNHLEQFRQEIKEDVQDWAKDLLAIL